MPSRLIVTQTGARAGEPPRTIELGRKAVTLGRSLENALPYPDERGLSRTHVSFEPDGGRCLVRDLESLNGTFVNGKRLAGAQELRDGDQIQVASLQIRFSQDAPTRPAEVTFEAPATAHSDAPAQVTNLQTILFRSKQPTQSDVPALDSRRMAAEALLRVGRELARNQPLAELFETILRLATSAVGAERGVLITLQNGRPTVQARQGTDFRISHRVRDQVLDEKLSLLIRDVQVDPSWEAHQSLVAQGVRSLMAVPLQTDEKVIGMLYLDSAGSKGKFDAHDLELLTVMANVAAIRIEREHLIEAQRAAEMLERELSQAAEIQRQCLPEKPPEMPGADLAAISRPCYTVGGDYYDFLPAKRGRLGLVVADVAGKGLSAALLMMNLQARVQVLAAELEDPSAVVARLNEMLLPVCPANRFVTLVFGFFDPSTGEMHYSNAGHEPPLLVRAAGGVETLAEGGPVVGLLPNLQFATGRCTLTPGDALVFFSDGLTEARGPAGEEFGPERIAAAFREAGPGSASERLHGVARRVSEWLGESTFHDDMTVVTLLRPS
ncbi:MAG: SpoIIE family protein phosphatase [Acidobacteria bacterium]|nr:SpoIIE family protein phosphatase [Acidobacteriota bacterium]